MELNKSIHNDSLFIRVGLSGNLMVSIQRLYNQTGILKISKLLEKGVAESDMGLLESLADGQNSNEKSSDGKSV
jgi:hypothetical protein